MANFTPQQIEEFLQEFFDVVGARQYVGARYVPIFGRAGEDTVEWDDGAPYEPLTVVMHEGVSYVSRRYVPRGIQITDTAYWVETYRFNAQVEQYRQEVLQFDGRIDAVADDIAAEAQAREEADAQVLADVANDYVPFPDPNHYPKYGTADQVLSTLTNGETKWVDPVIPDSATVGTYVSAWLDDHPEATTTVQDGAITTPKLAGNAVTDAKIADVTKFVRVFPVPVIGGANGQSYATHLPDLNNAVDNMEYRFITIDPASQYNPANMPSGLIAYRLYKLETFSAVNESGTYGPNKAQTITDLTDMARLTYWRREYRNQQSTWTAWQKISLSNTPDDNTVSTAKIVNYAVTAEKIYDVNSFRRFNIYLITTGESGNYNVHLPDFNNAIPNMTYRIVPLDYTNNIPAHCPSGLVAYKVYHLETFSAIHEASNPNKFQRLSRMDEENHVHYWTRQYTNFNNTWSDWIETDISNSGGKTIIVGPNHQYTSILAGVMEALKTPHSHVLVKYGTYDIAQEILDYYGNDFLSGNNVHYRGIPLGNYITVEFESGAVAELDLSDASFSDSARSMVSIFNSGDSNPEYNNTGFTLINATLIGTNCRYCVHDEHGGVLDNYANHYVNCKMHKNITMQYEVQDQGQSNGYALGGGLGEHGYITFDGCQFSRTNTSGQTTNVDYPIFYHTSLYSQTGNALSKIYVRDCYFDTTIMLSTIGSDAMSQMFVSGCSVNAAPVITGNMTSGELIAWNNEIRTP